MLKVYGKFRVGGSNDIFPASVEVEMTVTREATAIVSREKNVRENNRLTIALY
jgi:hypothetical protein